MKLRLYTDRNCITEGSHHVPLLDPFWGFDRYDPEGNLRQCIGPYLDAGAEIFELVPSPAMADVVLIPVDWCELLTHPKAMSAANDSLQAARDAGKPAIIFFSHDAPLEFEWPEHALVFRIAVHRSRRKKTEFIAPQWSKDYLADELAGVFPVRQKSPVATVGFCGYSPPLGLKPGRRWLKESARLAAHAIGLTRLFPERAAHAARTRALISLSRSPHVRCNFLIRGESAFDNQHGAFLPGGTPEAALRRRREFTDNIVGSDYVLCARGWANCSIRFSETLSLGRIPVLVETDGMLPYEFAIDWPKHAVIVPEADLSQTGRSVRNFHESLTNQDFLALQRACRDLYDEWLSPLGFFRNLHRHLDHLPARSEQDAVQR